MAHDVRDQVLGFVRRWSGKTAIGVGAIHSWLGVTASKFYIGDSVTVVSTNTTVGFPVILGWSCGKGSDHRFPFENRLEGYRLGANSYVRKPVDFTEFIDAVRYIVSYWLHVNEPFPPLSSP